MAQDTATHIAQRNRQAAQTMAGQTLADRMISKPGLTFANWYDRGKAFLHLDTNTSVFLRAGALGVVRGAFYGALLAVAGITLLGVPAAIAMLSLSGAGAVIFGVKDAQRRLDYHLYSGHGNISDWVAKKSGAVGKVSQAHSLPETPYEAHITIENPDAKSGHRAREEARRAKPPRVEGLGEEGMSDGPSL